MVSRKQAAVGTLWGTLERAATQGISFVVIALLARLLGPQDFGIVTLAATITLLAQSLIGETFSQALIQADKVEPAHISSLFWLLIAAGVIAMGTLAGLSDWLAAVFDLHALGPILRAISPLPLLTAMQAVPAALFKRELNFRALATASAAGNLIGGVTGVGLAFAGFGPWSIVASLLVQNGFVTTAIWRKARFRVQRVYSWSHIRELWSFGQYTFLLRIASFTANQGPRILVGYLFGAAALGIFSLGLKIMETMYEVLTLPAANVAIPVIAKIRRDPDRLERAILSTTQLAAAISVPAFLGLAITAPLVVPLIFGPKWAESVIIVQLLALAGIVGSIGLVNLNIVMGLGRPNVNLAVTTAAAVASIAIILLTAPWGLVAATIAFIVRGYLTLPLLVLLVAQMTGIRAAKLYAVYVPIALAAVPMVAVVASILHWAPAGLAPPIMIVLVVASGVACYWIGLYVFARSALRLAASVFS